MKRLLINDLAKWKTKDNRKPLLLQGTRQVGKTYLVKQFGKLYYKNIHIVNFDEKQYHEIFLDGPVDIGKIIMRLELLLDSKINPDTDLIFFDEIQQCDTAIHSLKYFFENAPNYHIICAGSYIGVTFSKSSFPVGKINYKRLYPLNFVEFLNEYKPFLVEYLCEAVKTLSLDDIAHKKLWEAYKIYSLVGGMPEAVKAFLNEDSVQQGFVNARLVHIELLNGYRNDFGKYNNNSNTFKIESVFNSISAQLQAVHDGTTKRFKFSSILPKTVRYYQLETPIDWLVHSGLAIKTPVISSINMPLQQHIKPSFFKLCILDTGLLQSILEVNFSSVINNTEPTYKGFIAEHFVNQELQLKFSENIFSWENKKSEIEFLLPINGQATPIEVKSGSRTKAKSLSAYKKRYSPKLSIKLSSNNIRVENNHLNAPLYMAGFLQDMANTFYQQSKEHDL